MSSEKNAPAKANSLNRAKLYQLVLFPFNNGATNVYYILTLNFIGFRLKKRRNWKFIRQIPQNFFPNLEKA